MREPEAPCVSFAGAGRSLELLIHRRIEPPQMDATPIAASAAMQMTMIHSCQRDPAAIPRLCTIAGEYHQPRATPGSQARRRRRTECGVRPAMVLVR